MSIIISGREMRMMSAANAVECSIVSISRLGTNASVRSWMEDIGIDIVPVDAAQAHLAGEAFLRFGKGRHPAGLNYGDCFAYALWKTSGEALHF